MNIDKLIGSQLRRAIKDEPRGGTGFGLRLAKFLGREWSKQTVYDAGQGLRKFRVAELVAIAQATGRPAHYFLEAPVGVEAVELDPGAAPIDAGRLRDLFRIPEPRDLKDPERMLLNAVEGVLEDLEAQRKDLAWALGIWRSGFEGGES